MPTISTHNLQMNPQQLSNMDGMLPTLFPYALDWQKRASQMDQTTLEDAMREAAVQRQLDQFRVPREQADLDAVVAGTEGTRASTESTRANIPLIQQNVRAKTLQNDVDEYVLPQKKISEYQKLLSDQSLDKVKQHEAEVIGMIQSQDPQQRKVGLSLFPYLKASLEEKMKTDQQLRVQGVSHANAISLQDARFKHENALEDKRIEAGKYKNKSGETAVDIINSVKAGKLSYEKAATSFEVLSRMEEDPVKAKQYADLAATFGAEALKAAQARSAGKVDLNAQGIETVPQPNSGLGNLPQSAATADRKDRQDNAERVIIYKDGKAVGTVPKSQVEQAKQEGYTVK